MSNYRCVVCLKDNICINSNEVYNNGDLIAEYHFDYISNKWNKREYFYEHNIFKLIRPYYSFEFTYLNDKIPFSKLLGRRKYKYILNTEGLSNEVIKELYYCVFQYLEKIKEIDILYLNYFKYTLFDTLNRSTVIRNKLLIAEKKNNKSLGFEEEFSRVIRSSKKIFKGIYEVVISIDEEVKGCVQYEFK